MLACILSAVGLTAAALARADPNLEQLDSELEGQEPLFACDGESFTNASRAHNLRFAYEPVAIVYPTSVEEVSAAVKAAADQNISIAARGGGHDFTALGIGGEDGAMVIDMSHFQSVEVDEDSYDAIIGAGALIGDVALALSDKGRGMPHGACPYVGVGGHFALGGYGFMSRMWGLSLDTIVEYDLVLANGTVAQVTADSHPDLFWALQGAASSFGIVTHYKVKTFEAPASSVYYQYNWNLTAEEGVEFVRLWQKFLQDDLSPKVGIQIDFMKGPERGSVLFILRVAYYGPEEDYLAMIEPLLNQLPQDYEMLNAAGEYIIVAQTLAQAFGQQLDTSVQPNPDDTFYAKSLMTPPLNDEAIESYLHYLANEGFDTELAWFVFLYLHGGKDSAINAPASDATAFAHRDSFYVFQMKAWPDPPMPPFPDDGLSLLDGMIETVTANMDLGEHPPAYINYVDDRVEDPQQVYYGGNSHRLGQLKSKYDPQHLIRFPTSIKPVQDRQCHQK